MKLNKYYFLLFLVFDLCSFVHAQTKPLSAEQIITSAKKEASKSGKNIFIIFHASWCVWCHKMDSALNDKKVKSFFDDNYLIKHLTIDESKDKKYLENPGASEMRTTYHGDNQGIPYWFILDKNGQFLADSRFKDDSGKAGDNVGCPAKSDEVEYFVKVIQKTSHLTTGQLNLIRERFLKNQ